MRTVEILRAGRELIAEPAKLARNVLARDAHGHAIDPCDKDAVCLCAIGAILRAACQLARTQNVGVVLLDRKQAQTILHNAARELTLVPRNATLLPAAYLNDYTDHATVLQMFDRAIQMAEEAERATTRGA